MLLVVLIVVESEVGEATAHEDDDAVACTAEATADVLRFPSVASSLSVAVCGAVVGESETWTPESSV